MKGRDHDHSAVRLLAAVVMLPLLAGPAAADTPEGAYLADRVNIPGYYHLMDAVLYTHDGHDRGWGPEHDMARENIFDHFQGLGLDTSLHLLRYYHVEYFNVVGEKLGTVAPDEIIIASAHYDSVSNPGADDNASGVSAVMHAAWILARADLERTIRFIAFDREEQGLVGSWRYAWDYRNDNIVAVVNLDMIAHDHWGEQTAEIFGREASDPVKQALADAVQTYGGLNVVVGGRRDSSDHAPFEEFGFQAGYLNEAGPNTYYHTQLDSIDSPDYLDFDYATRMTRGLVGFLADQAGAVTLPCWSDLNGDRVVNQVDFLFFASAFGSDWTAPGYDPFADMNGDGVVNVTDLTWFALDYHQPCP